MKSKERSISWIEILKTALKPTGGKVAVSAFFGIITALVIFFAFLFIGLIALPIGAIVGTLEVAGTGEHDSGNVFISPFLLGAGYAALGFIEVFLIIYFLWSGVQLLWLVGKALTEKSKRS